MTRRLDVSLAALLSAALLAAARSAPADPSGTLHPSSTILVNSTLDLPDADPNDGIPDADLATAGLQTTLRAAIMHANTLGSAHIDLPAGTYALAIGGGGENEAATGDLDITSAITLVGAGASTTIIDGKKSKDRAFDVRSEASLSASRLTVRSAKTPKVDAEGGGGFRNRGDLTLLEVVIAKCSAVDQGGGIEHRSGTLTLTDVVIQANKSRDDGGGLVVKGGVAVLTRVSFVKNKARDEGGALENSGAVVTLNNVTFSGNQAKEVGGAVSVEENATTSLESCTFAGNKALEGAAITTIENTGTTTVHNTLFGQNKKVNCLGSLTSLGGNLDFGTSCGFGAGDLSSTDPLLAPLAENGGLTPTHALLPGSPCIDAGDDTACQPQDQRGLNRVDIAGVGSTVCDIGAFEAQGSP